MLRSFADRRDAGRFLAQKLRGFANRDDAMVLALPRGGVPVAYEIASALNLPMDVLVIRKLGAPSNAELAIGAISSGGGRVLNLALIERLGVTPEMLELVTAQERQELERRERLYRGDRPPVEVAGQTLLLVDDGLATGASMRAAVQALRPHRPSSMVVAVPVGARDTCRKMALEVEEIVCGRCPKDLSAIGMWYGDFSQTSDEEVAELMGHLDHQRRANLALKSKPGLSQEVLTGDG